MKTNICILQCLVNFISNFFHYSSQLRYIEFSINLNITRLLRYLAKLASQKKEKKRKKHLKPLEGKGWETSVLKHTPKENYMGNVSL